MGASSVELNVKIVGVDHPASTPDEVNELTA